MSKRIFNNIFIKIISAILAIIAWLILVNVSDPTTNITISGVNVNFENESALAEKGYTYEVVDGSKISVDLSGPKSEITTLRASDISAVVDLAEMSEFSDYADISVTVKKDGKDLKNINVTPKTSSVKLNIGNRTQTDYKVDVQVKGTLESDEKLAELTASPFSVRIAGPSEDMKKITGVKAVIDIQDKTDEISEDVPLEMTDSEGKVIKDDLVQMSRQTVRVTGKLITSKKVPIVCKTQGNPEKGYEVKDVELSSKEITLSGSETILDGINEFEIPSSALNIEGIASDKTYRIWLSDYAPDGVNVVSDNSVQATVKIVKTK